MRRTPETFDIKHVDTKHVRAFYENSPKSPIFRLFSKIRSLQLIAQK